MKTEGSGHQGLERNFSTPIYIASRPHLFPAPQSIPGKACFRAIQTSTTPDANANSLNFIVFPEDNHNDMQTANATPRIFYIGTPAPVEAIKKAQSNDWKVYEIILNSSGNFSTVSTKDSQGSYIRIFCPNIHSLEHLTKENPHMQDLVNLITGLAEGTITPAPSSHHHRYISPALTLSPINQWTWKKEGRNVLIFFVIGLAAAYLFMRVLPKTVRAVASVGLGTLLFFKKVKP